MTKLTIVRPYEWFNLRKRIYVYIDDVKVGHVGIDETVQFDVLPGKHKLVLRNNWSGGSKPIVVNLNEYEDKTIKMSTFRYALILPILLGMFISTFYSFLNKQFNIEATISFGVYLLLSIGIGMTIILLVLRENYLRLIEVKTTL